MDLNTEYGRGLPQKQSLGNFTKCGRKLKIFMKMEDGATAIEYGLIAGGISVAIIAIVGTVGTDLVGLLTDISTSLNPPD